MSLQYVCLPVVRWFSDDYTVIDQMLNLQNFEVLQMKFNFTSVLLFSICVISNISRLFRQVFYQTIRIPEVTNCFPLLSDLFCFCMKLGYHTTFFRHCFNVSVHFKDDVIPNFMDYFHVHLNYRNKPEERNDTPFVSFRPRD